MAAHVGKPAHPGLRARHAGDRRRHHQDLADLIPGHHEALVTESEPNADPFHEAGVFAVGAGRCSAAATLDLPQELERVLPEGAQAALRRDNHQSLRASRTAATRSLSETGLVR